MPPLAGAAALRFCAHGSLRRKQTNTSKRLATCGCEETGRIVKPCGPSGSSFRSSGIGGWECVYYVFGLLCWLGEQALVVSMVA